MPAIDGELAQHLAALKEEKGGFVRIDDLGEVVRSLLISLSGDVSSDDVGMYREIESLATYIRGARAEIAALRPNGAQGDFIASATDELDAIVDATENAANKIMDGAEALESLAQELPSEQGQKLTDITTGLYEACNFQDITGQRITKVVRVIKHVEERVEALIKVFGPEFGEPPSAGEEERPLTDEDLLNGPQLPDSAADQAKIDAMFNS
ncbi:hypothetical protein FACS1894205_1030 [Alphaproteobacteria bacterium]|nr:hypothetical protein FACS1894205_1030 [Alphaproteobacteria bacterium]